MDEDALDLLGASYALSDQFITLRIRSVDREKLRHALGGSKGTLANAAMTFVDMAPKGALDIAKPLIQKAATDYGVDLDVVVADKPPTPGGRSASEFWPGLAVGAVAGGSMLVIWKLLARTVRALRR